MAVGTHQDNLVIVPCTGLMDPGHPGPPGTIALMAFSREQMPNHVARQFDERRRGAQAVGAGLRGPSAPTRQVRDLLGPGVHSIIVCSTGASQSPGDGAAGSWFVS
jgi:hypothetical protein